MSTELLLKNHQSPGDVLVMSAAVASLHHHYPQKYRVQVKTSANELWDHSPLVWEGPLLRPLILEMHYPAIHESGSRPVHFMGAYCEFLAQAIGRPVPLAVAAPVVGLTEWEKATPILGGRYWVINAGVKNDFTCKRWGVENFQQLVNLLAGRVRFVQVGAAEHNHPALENVVDLRGATTFRDLLRLCWHAAGGVGPSTLIQHVFAAMGRPYVCLLGGREPVTWTHYPTQQTLSTHGALTCCRASSCWRSRVVQLGDGAAQDISLCDYPVQEGKADAVPLCLDMISPMHVAEIIWRYGKLRPMAMALAKGGS